MTVLYLVMRRSSVSEIGLLEELMISSMVVAQGPS